jgi:hypothetical protein
MGGERTVYRVCCAKLKDGDHWEGRVLYMYRWDDNTKFYHTEVDGRV